MCYHIGHISTEIWISFHDHAEMIMRGDDDAQNDLDNLMSN